MNREPVAIVNAVRLLLLAAVSFGFDLTDVQIVASMAALEAVLTLFTRRQVTPTPSDDAGQANVTGVLWAVFLVLAIVVLLRVLGVV